MYSVYRITGKTAQLAGSSQDPEDVRIMVQTITGDAEEAQEAMEFAKAFDPGESFDSPFGEHDSLFGTFTYRVTCE